MEVGSFFFSKSKKSQRARVLSEIAGGEKKRRGLYKSFVINVKFWALGIQ